MPEVTSAGQVLAAMITPALLISATGTLVLSTSNRLSRVVDRVRVLSTDAERLRRPPEPDAPEPPELADAKRSLITSQLTALARRALLLRSALAALYAAIGFLVAASIAVGAITSFSVSAALGWSVIGLAMVGAAALLWGSVLLVREGRLAIGSTLEEMQYVRRVVAELPRPTGDLLAQKGSEGSGASV